MERTVGKKMENFRTVPWEFRGIKINMIEIGGDLFCTNISLCNALCASIEQFRQIHRRHRNEFVSLVVQNEGLREFLKLNKKDFDIKRVKKDLNLWSEDDMILFAVLSKSQWGREFRKDLVTHIKAQARVGMVSEDRYNLIQEQINQLKYQMDFFTRGSDEIASGEGKLLYLHKKTKPMRDSIKGEKNVSNI